MGKEKYVPPVTEKVKMVSSELLESMQTALQTATNTINNLKETSISNNEKYLRALADYQNLKRISDEKIANSKRDGKISVFKDLLPVLDNFEKAIEIGEVTDGIMLIYNGLKSIFNSNNIEVIDPKEGDIFDDSIYEAVAAIPGENKNTIVYTQSKGYKMNDVILRYAKVGVYV